MLVLALLLGSAVAPPPDDDDDKPAVAPSQTVQPKRPAQHVDDDDEDRAQPTNTIVVTARKLDTARTRIDAALGATVYSVDNDTIEDRPSGETGTVAQILGQAPDVTLSGKTIDVRGSPADQVRINGVIIPEAIPDPADLLSSRLAETTSLLAGTLPAQFGFAPSGVISITTKDGLYDHGGQAEFFAGTDGMLEPAFEWAGSAAATSLFASASLERARSAVADAAGIRTRDSSNQVEGLGFTDHIINQSDRISMIIGGSDERDHFGASSIGSGVEDSADGYAIGTFQHSDNGFTVQGSVFGGIASTRSRFAERTRERRSSVGAQVDASDEIATEHTLRFGLLANRSSADELGIADRTSAGRTSLAVYAQDEWKLTPSLTFDPGARLQWLRGFGSAAEIEPRATFVWESGGGLAAHAGYARYASAPQVGEEPAGTNLGNESDNYLDAGVQQRIGSFTFGLDAYWRAARHYIAERQTIGSSVPVAFAFNRARISGVELSATYARGAFSAWGNLALSRGRARDIVGGGTLFSPDVLPAAAARSIPLAGDRPVSASGGLSWRKGKLNLSADVLVSSGAVRTAAPELPDGSRHSAYATLGLAAVYHARIAGEPVDLRADLTNLTNARYSTSDATNLGGGWTRFGEGRALTVGIEQGF